MLLWSDALFGETILCPEPSYSISTDSTAHKHSPELSNMPRSIQAYTKVQCGHVSELSISIRPLHGAG